MQHGRLTVSTTVDQQGVRALGARAATASLPTRPSARKHRSVPAARAPERALALQTSKSPPNVPRPAVLSARDPYTPRARRDDPKHPVDFSPAFWIRVIKAGGPNGCMLAGLPPRVVCFPDRLRLACCIWYQHESRGVLCVASAAPGLDSD